MEGRETEGQGAEEMQKRCAETMRAEVGKS
jgi:hypothetical protein